MRSGTPWRRSLALLCLLVFSLLPSGSWAQDQPHIEEEMNQEEIEEVFWPAWNKFVKDVTESSLHNNPDPWESWNRKVFAFNDTADRWVLKPVARGYQWITPDAVETGVSNVFSNIFEITTIFNDLLQFKFSQAASDTGRFVVNSTVGLVGLFDVASAIGLEKHKEDFGQTLGYWGVGSGPYMVVPLLGSYTLRSGTGGIVESQTTDLVHYVDPSRSRNQVRLTRIVGNRASLIAAESLITGDRYSFIRDAYLQQREFLVNDGVVEDTFGDEDFEDDWVEEWDDGEDSESP